MLIATGPDNNPIEVQADANGNLKTTINGSLANTRLASSLTSTSVAATNGTEIIDILPTAGKCAEWLAMYLSINPPTGATTGGHNITARLVTGATTIPIFTISATYNGTILFSNGVVTYGTATPSDIASFHRTLERLLLDSNSFLRLTYTNNTDVATTQSRDYRFIFNERKNS